MPEIDLDTRSAGDAGGARHRCARAAASDATVLLRGENGTGKGVLARALHAQQRARARGRSSTVNCPTLSEELLASELFGHARGAFTGAVRDQPGRVEAADGGTLFLDEIGEISPGLQAKLLRFLQEQAVRARRRDARRGTPTCASSPPPTATSRADVRAGRFREDLLYRLNVVEVRVPPLRERREDILPPGARASSRSSRAAARRPVPELSPAAAAVAARLRLAGQRARAAQRDRARGRSCGRRRVLEPAAFPERIAGHAGRRPRDSAATSPSTRSSASTSCASSPRSATLEDAARILGIDASTLWRKRKRYDI